MSLPQKVAIALACAVSPRLGRHAYASRPCLAAHRAPLTALTSTYARAASAVFGRQAASAWLWSPHAHAPVVLFFFLIFSITFLAAIPLTAE